jgi:signal transduction histidine kinase
MTIKRRLVISNIMMLVIPVLLGIAIAAALKVTSERLLGMEGFDDSFFYDAARDVRAFAGTWDGEAQGESVAAGMRGLAREPGWDNLFWAVFEDGERVDSGEGEAGDDDFVRFILGRRGEHFFEMDKTHIYKTDAGPCAILLVFRDVKWTGADYRGYIIYLINLGILLAAILVLVVSVTNRVLTQRIFRSIMRPLDTLVRGVHQIRDGNLSYRIVYTKGDEFAAVCFSFNEMAQRLLDMVNARQKDDENRRELIAGISHDLRTPLTSIKAYVEGLEKGLASTSEIQDRYVGTLKNKAADMEHILSQLFLFSRLDVGEFPFYLETIDIAACVAEFVRSSADEYRHKGLELELGSVSGFQAGEEGGEVSMERAGPRAGSVWVRADCVQLRSVFVNILENSVKYGARENGCVRFSVCADGQTVTLALTDNGPGVPEDSLEKLFNVFYRGDKARSVPGRGSGLGLAISAKIIEGLGGRIRAENAGAGVLAGASGGEAVGVSGEILSGLRGERFGGLCICIRLPRVEGPA